MDEDWDLIAAAIVDGKNTAVYEISARVGKDGLVILCEADEMDVVEWTGRAMDMAAHQEDGRWERVIKGRSPNKHFNSLGVNQLIDRHEILL